MQNAKKIKFLIIALLVFFNIQLFSQSNEIKISKKYDGLAWNSFIERIEKDYSVRFFYDNTIIPEINISIKSDTAFLKDVLYNNFLNYNIAVSIDKMNNIFLVQKDAIKVSLDDDFFITTSNNQKAETETSEKKADKNNP